MKTVLIFSLLIAVSLANEGLVTLEAAAKECGDEGPNNLRAQVLNENADKVKLGQIIFCINKKLGIQKDNGDLDENGLRKHLQDKIIDETLLNKIVVECSKRNGDTSEAVAFNFLKCYQTLSNRKFN